jgi:hypothetical protein
VDQAAIQRRVAFMENPLSLRTTYQFTSFSLYARLDYSDLRDATIARMVLALLGWNRPDPGRELCVILRVDRPVSYRSARRVLAEKVVILPVLRWPDRSRNKAATTVGAHVAQYAIVT